jgi:hypothetical protein
MPLKGGEETRVLDQPGAWFNCLNASAEPNGRIEFFDFATRETTPSFSLEKPASAFGGLAVSPDGRSLLYGQIEVDDSSVMLVKTLSIRLKCRPPK